MIYVVHITGCGLEEAEKLKDWLQRVNDTKVVIEE